MASILEKIISECPSPGSIRIKNMKDTEKIIQALVNNGHERLQVITDFDMTLSRYHEGGVRCHSSYGVLDYSPLMPDAFRKTTQSITAKYYPIEIDHELTIEEKIPHMADWYRQSHSAIASHAFQKSLVKEMVAQSRVMLRDNAVDTLKALQDADVPVLILSAGLGNVLEEVLLKYGVFYPNIKIISNFMIFDEEGKVVGFEEPVLHMYNKNISAITDVNYFEKMAHRKNVILLGDSLGDVHMSTGVPNIEVQLRIGFLNIKIEECMQAYMDNFDIVIVDDQSMKFFNLLLGSLLPTT